MLSLKTSFIHLYTGSGKGKTTAAIGLALRAAGAGLRVYFAQFAKGTDTGEFRILSKLTNLITIKQFGARSFIKGRPSKNDKTLAANGFALVEKIIREGRYDVVVLDEICIACYYKIIPLQAVIDMIQNRPDHVEIVLTGRNAPQELIDAADLVTEMREIKHYFAEGVHARKGIEF
jgi:cob(I)alamin adenosyltransferase